MKSFISNMQQYLWVSLQGPACWLHCLVAFSSIREKLFFKKNKKQTKSKQQQKHGCVKPHCGIWTLFMLNQAAFNKSILSIFFKFLVSERLLKKKSGIVFLISVLSFNCSCYSPLVRRPAMGAVCASMWSVQTRDIPKYNEHTTGGGQYPPRRRTIHHWLVLKSCGRNLR